MRSPADMKIIQIDITNACMFSCSNCTRFCGQHKKPFFMGVDTFRRAVDSLQGYSGIVGIIGGEPTIHPDFDRLMDYYVAHVPETRPAAFLDQPVSSFADYARMIRYMRGRRRGLFSSLGAGYYRHFEQIQDVFAYQSINDHRSVNAHQAVLVTRKELGIPDGEWYALRDSCWIQNLWSASITPKGAFFCEIAGCLDMLFDGPGGWPIEPGWWKRQPADFADQLHWCEMCSIALKVPTIDASRQTDIVSPAILERLQQINGPKIRNGKYVVFDPAGYDASKFSGHAADPIWYLPNDQRDDGRVSATHDTLFPRQIDVAVLEGSSRLSTISTDQLRHLDFKDWVAVFANDVSVSEKFLTSARRCILNPGCLYYRGGEVWLFHRRAKALRGREALELSAQLPVFWERRKRVPLRQYPWIDKPNPWQKLGLRLRQWGNRGAFLLPAGSR